MRDKVLSATDTVGKLAGMSKRDAQKLIRGHGGVAVERADVSADIVVVGEQELPLGDPHLAEDLLDEAVRGAAESGSLEIISETQLWQRRTGTRRRRRALRRPLPGDRHRGQCPPSMQGHPSVMICGVFPSGPTPPTGRW